MMAVLFGRLLNRILPCKLVFFFFNDTATTEIYTLSLHDALPIFSAEERNNTVRALANDNSGASDFVRPGHVRSEEHTSELQSHLNLVCRLLLEKKNIPGRDRFIVICWCNDGVLPSPY